MNRSLASRILPFVAVAVALSYGQTKSNLNGVWKMDPARSDFGSGPVSESRLDHLSIDGVNVKDGITQKLRRGPETTYEMNYTTDGQESTNRVRGNTVKSTARWEGNDLIIDSKVFALRQANIQDRWSVSADGKTITLLRHMTGAVTAEQKIIFDRQ